jgi:DNA (cytosine-5)-methyltransferase 1
MTWDDFGAVPVVAGPRRSGPDRPARYESCSQLTTAAGHLVPATVPAGGDRTPTVDHPTEVRGSGSFACVVMSVLGDPTFHHIGRPDLPHRELLFRCWEVWAHDELLNALPAEVESLRNLGSAHQVMHDGNHSHDASGHLTSGQEWARIGHVTSTKLDGRKVRRATSRTATHRPAARHRRWRHDDLVAVDLFSGFGGLTKGIEMAGFTTIMAANHNEYKVRVHEANHPHAEHWIADLVDPDSSDYHSARDLPSGDILVAGISCTNHSQANTQKAYSQGLTLFDFQDEEFDERVTHSERDRATALCVLQYAERHRPRMILVECTTEFQSWGPALPNRRKVGDGSTYRWWLQQLATLEYEHRVLFLNSQFFGVPQSRDRWFGVFWQKELPAPDLDHRPMSWCDRCQEVIPAVWSWKTGIPPTGAVRYSKQYNYRCPRCRDEVIPPMAPSINCLDLTDLGTRIGDRTKPLAPATMARAERCRQRFPEFPAILMPAKAVHGTERHPWQPMATQTSQQETALLSTGAVMVAAGNAYERPGSECRSRNFDQPLWSQTATNAVGLVTPPVALTGQVFAAHRHNGDGQPITRPMDTVTSTHEKAMLIAINNFQGAPRSVDGPLPTQPGSETLGLVSAGVVPFRKHTVPTMHAEPMPTVTAEQTPALLTASGTIKNNGSIDEARYRAHPVSDPLGTVIASSASQGLLFSGWYKQNGTDARHGTAPHPTSDPLGTLTAHDTTALLTAEWHAALADLSIDDCYFRMLHKHEVGRGCGFDTTFPGHEGTFVVWGSARHQIDGFGNAVSPQVGAWIGSRLRAVLDSAGGDA